MNNNQNQYNNSNNNQNLFGNNTQPQGNNNVNNLQTQNMQQQYNNNTNTVSQYNTNAINNSQSQYNNQNQYNNSNNVQSQYNSINNSYSQNPTSTQQYNNSINSAYSTQQYNNTATNTFDTNNNQNINNNGNSNNFSNNNFFKNLLKNKKIIVIFVVMVVAVIGSVFGVKVLKNKNNNNKLKENETFNIDSSGSFCLANAENNKYAVFSREGKQITDFIFTKECHFYNGVAEVVNDKNESAIINEKGKYIADFGEYSLITQTKALFYVRKDNKNYIINSKGKIIKNVNNLRNKFKSLDFDGILYSLKDNDLNNVEKTYIYDYEGRELLVLDTDQVKARDGADNKYFSIYANNKSYIFDVTNGKKLYELPGEMYVSSYNGDNVIISKEVDANYTHVVYNKNTQVFKLENKECREPLKFIDGGYACVKNDIVLFDKNGKLINDKVVQFKDVNNYVARVDKQKNQNKYMFYKDGKLIKTLELTAIYKLGELAPTDYIAASLKVDCQYGEKVSFYCIGTNYYDYAGNVINKTPFYGTNYSFSYDEYNKKSFATKNIKTVNKTSYLINNKFEKISEEYKALTYTGVRYIYWVATTDNGKDLLDLNGNKIKSGFNNIRVLNYPDDNLALLTYTDRIIIYDLKNKKEFLTIDSSSSYNIYEDYIMVTTGNTKEYYSYVTGKKFYEINK